MTWKGFIKIPKYYLFINIIEKNNAGSGTFSDKATAYPYQPRYQVQLQKNNCTNKQ